MLMLKCTLRVGNPYIKHWYPKAFTFAINLTRFLPMRPLDFKYLTNKSFMKQVQPWTPKWRDSLSRIGISFLDMTYSWFVENISIEKPILYELANTLWYNTHVCKPIIIIIMSVDLEFNKILNYKWQKLFALNFDKSW